MMASASWEVKHWLTSVRIDRSRGHQRRVDIIRTQTDEPMSTIVPLLRFWEDFCWLPEQLNSSVSTIDALIECINATGKRSVVSSYHERPRQPVSKGIWIPSVSWFSHSTTIQSFSATSSRFTHDSIKVRLPFSSGWLRPSSSGWSENIED